MLMRRYEMPWRRAYEVYAAAVWASALLFFAVTGGLGLLPRQLALPLAAFCLAMGVLRLAQGVHTLVLRASLSGRGIQVLSTRAVARWTEKPDAVLVFGKVSGGPGAQRRDPLGEVRSTPRGGLSILPVEHQNAVSARHFHHVATVTHFFCHFLHLVKLLDKHIDFVDIFTTSQGNSFLPRHIK